MRFATAISPRTASARVETHDSRPTHNALFSESSFESSTSDISRRPGAGPWAVNRVTPDTARIDATRNCWFAAGKPQPASTTISMTAQIPNFTAASRSSRTGCGLVRSRSTTVVTATGKATAIADGSNRITIYSDTPIWSGRARSLMNGISISAEITVVHTVTRVMMRRSAPSGHGASRTVGLAAIIEKSSADPPANSHAESREAGGVLPFALPVGDQWFKHVRHCRRVEPACGECECSCAREHYASCAATHCPRHARCASCCSASAHSAKDDQRQEQSGTRLQRPYGSRG